MATFNIGNRSEAYIVNKGNTDYVLDAGDHINAPSQNYGIYMGDDRLNVTFEINGRITANTAMKVYSSVAENGTDTLIGETGRLTGTQTGIAVDGDGHRIVNHGLIKAGSHDGIRADGTTSIVNTGTIDAGYAGIYGAAGTDERISVRNSGSIEGGSFGMRFGFSNDTIINSGTIAGDVLLGAGNDRFIFNGGKVTDTVYGSAGNDTYVLKKAGVDLFEYAGGAEGTDTVKTMFTASLGDNFENLVLMGRGDWSTIGNELDNVLTGNSGRNSLFGNDGVDVLKGGRGDDVLSGGAGADEFHFGAGTGRDVVVDYSDGLDVIHLNGMTGATDFADLMANHAVAKGNDVWITYGSDVIVLANTVLNHLSQGDFVFS